MIDKPEKFWERLNNWIGQEGLSLYKFAAQAGISYMSIKSPCDRNSIPGPEILVKIAEYTGLSIEYFVIGKDPWSGKDIDADTARLMEDIASAPDETRERIKAILEADRRMLEKRAADKQDTKKRRA